MVWYLGLRAVYCTCIQLELFAKRFMSVPASCVDCVSPVAKDLMRDRLSPDKSHIVPALAKSEWSSSPDWAEQMT